MIIFPDPIFEEEFLTLKEKQNKLFKDNVQMFKDNPNFANALTQNVIELDNLPKAAVVGLTQLGKTADDPDVQELQSSIYEQSVKKEAEIWEQINQKYQSQDYHDDMRMTSLNGAKGDVQYGVWFAAGLDWAAENFSIWNPLPDPSYAGPIVKGKDKDGNIVNIQNPDSPAAGRAWKYIQALAAYDKMLIDGVAPDQAAKNIKIDISGADVPNLGIDTSWRDDVKKTIDIISEAKDKAGEPILNAMIREAQAGKPLNYNRDNWFTFETIDARKMPHYQDLTKIYGYNDQQAVDLIYKHIGRPLAPLEESGEINYLSLEKPNQINFFAGRRNKSFVYKTDDLMRNEESYEQLLPYSPGRYQASYVHAPGTDAFNKLSGKIDFVYKAVPEILAGKGTKGISNQFKNLRRVNRLLEAEEAGQIVRTGKKINLNPGGIRNEVIDKVGNAIDGITGKGISPSLISWKTAKLKEVDEEAISLYKASKRLMKEYGIAGGRVPRFFQQTKDEFLSTPYMEELYTALAETNINDIARIKGNPFFRDTSGNLVKQIAKETDRNKIKQTFGQLLDEGVTIKNQGTKSFDQIQMMPKAASFALNKALIDTAKVGEKLSGSDSLLKKGAGQLLETIGNKDAKYRSIRSYLGQGLNASITPFTSGKKFKKTLSVIKPLTQNDKVIDGTFALSRYLPRKQNIYESFENLKTNIQEIPNVTDKKYEKLLGFGSIFNAGYTPSQRKMLSVIPEMGMPLRNADAAFDQLYSHLQAVGYDEKQMSAILNEFLTVDFNDHRKVRKFAYEQGLRDVDLVKQQGGQYKVVGEAMKKQYADEEKRFKMFIDEMGEDMPFNAMGGEGLEKFKTVDYRGQEVNIIVPSAHLISEMADNSVQLMDYRLVNRAMGSMFKQYDEIDTIWDSVGIFYNDSKKWISYRSKWGKEALNPFMELTEDGTYKFKGLPTKDLAADALTLTLDFYNRNLFKPMVLLRAAFFTRVFLEEQMRFVAGHMDGFFNHPLHYIQWVTTGPQKSRLGKGLQKLLRKEGTEISDTNKLFDSFEYLNATQQTFSMAGLQGRSSLRNKAVKYVAKKKSQLSPYEYAEAVGFELLLLRNDDIANKVAQFGYGSDELMEWLFSKEGALAREKLVDMGGSRFSKLTNDMDFIDQYLQSIEARIRIKTGQFIRKGDEVFYDDKTKTYRYNIDKSYTGNQGLRDAIFADEIRDFNNIGGIKIGDDLRKPLKKNQERDFYKMIQTYIDPDGGDMDLGFVKLSEDLVKRKDMKFLARVEDRMDTAVNYAFQHLMTKPNAYLSRSVAFNQFRYAWILDNFKNFDGRVRKQFIDEAVQLGIPKKVVQEMRGFTKLPAGSVTDFKVADVNARAYGLSGTKALLYDTSKRHMLSDVTRNVFPFPEVWFELATTWGKLLGNNPYLLRKGQVAVRGARGSSALGFNGEGFFAPDPANEDADLYIAPFGGYLGNLIYGSESKTKIVGKSYVTGINLLGQGFVPGPNPYVAFALNKVLPKNGIGVEFRETIFGEFTPNESFIKQVVPTSPWLKKAFAAIGGAIGGDENATDIYKSELEAMRASSTIDIYRYGKITGEEQRLFKAGKLDKYLKEIYGGSFNPDDVDAADIDKAFLEYSKSKANLLFAVRAIVQFAGPTGIKPVYYAEDKDGKLWGVQVLAEEYRKIRDDLDGDDVQAAEKFVSEFGMEHGWLTSGKSISKEGRRFTTARSQEWADKNKDVLNQYTLSAYYLLPDNPADERSFSQLYQDSVMLTPDEYRRSVNDTIGYYKYAAFSKKVDDSELNSNEKVILKRIFRNSLIQDLPGFQSQQYGLTTAVKAKEILAEMKDTWLNPNSFAAGTEAGKGFTEMWQVWSQLEAQSMTLSDTNNPEWWLSSEKDEARIMRVMAHQVALEVSKKYPDFYYVWMGVMLRLFRDDTEALQFSNVGK